MNLDIMEPARIKKKTRRGKKKTKSIRELIPKKPVTCGCGWVTSGYTYGRPLSPVKYTTSHHGHAQLNKNNSHYLRPAPPMAPHNSTQFIMECHMDNELKFYPEAKHFSKKLYTDRWAWRRPTTPPEHESSPRLLHGERSPAVGEGSSDVEYEFESDSEELDMVDFLLKDFESIMNEFHSDIKLNRSSLEGKVFFSPRPRQEFTSGYNVPRCHSSTCSCHSNEKTPSDECLSRYTPTTSKDGRDTSSDDCSSHWPYSPSASRSSENSTSTFDESQMTTPLNRSADSSDDSTTDSFIKFILDDFESELRRTREEILFEKSSCELKNDIKIMQNRIDYLFKLQQLRSHFDQLRTENLLLRSENLRLHKL